jgi:phosphate transport system protein
VIWLSPYQYQDELDDFKADVLDFGRTVRERLADARTAFSTAEPDVAKTVIAGDEAINDRYLELEADCINFFANQALVASDLRFVAASFKILTDVERIGDLAKNVGQYTLATPADTLAEIDIAPIGEHALRLVDTALEAYEQECAATCYAVATSDAELDAHCQRASSRLVGDVLDQTAPGATDDRERLLDALSGVMLAIRDFERVGDHAVNIAARTLYMVANDPELIY